MMCSHPLALKINHEKRCQPTSDENSEVIDIGNWWRQFCLECDLEKIDHSAKLVFLMAVLNECEKREEKLVIFSHSRNTLDVIAYFLKKIKGYTFETEYYMIHGGTSIDKRNDYCEKFNENSNKMGR